MWQCAPGKAYRTLKRLGCTPGEDLDTGCFTIPDHAAKGLTAAQSADIIADSFAQISQEYPELKVENLPTRVIHKLQNINVHDIPNISEKQTYDKMMSAKLTMGGVPGDLPCQLTKTIGHHLKNLLRKYLIVSPEQVNGPLGGKWRREEPLRRSHIINNLSQFTN